MKALSNEAILAQILAHLHVRVVRVACEVELSCTLCGARWSVEGPLDQHPAWFDCPQCQGQEVSGGESRDG
jgi:hypothetical protein